MEGITRAMTNEELRGLSVDGIPGVNLNKPKRQLNAREKFEVELHKQEAIATRNGKPFARHIAREEFNKKIKEQVDKQCREYGSVEKPEELKLPKVDWDRYSNLKNFELIKTHERADGNLSRANPGLSVKIEFKTYKFKGYGFLYKTSESGPDAIARAIRARAKLDKTISQEMDKK